MIRWSAFRSNAMRKQELVHLHYLLADVGTFVREESRRSIDLAEYESLGTSPSALHRNKSAHRKAIFALTEAIIDHLREEPTPRLPATAG